MCVCVCVCVCEREREREREREKAGTHETRKYSEDVFLCMIILLIFFLQKYFQMKKK